MCPIVKGGRAKTDVCQEHPQRSLDTEQPSLKLQRPAPCNSRSQARSSNILTFAFLLHILPSPFLKNCRGSTILDADLEFMQTCMKPVNTIPTKHMEKLRDCNNSPSTDSPKSHSKVPAEPEIEPRPPDSKPWALTKTPASLHHPSLHILQWPDWKRHSK